MNINKKEKLKIIITQKNHLMGILHYTLNLLFTGNINVTSHWDSPDVKKRR